MKRQEDPNQLHIDWTGAAAKAAATTQQDRPKPKPKSPAATSTHAAPSPLVQVLPWDFRTTFPEPTEEAIAAGTIQPEDRHPTSIKAIHDEHTREALSILHDLDAVLDARRRGLDPHTGKPPRTHVGKERLRRLFDKEPARLERAFANIIGVYADAFGTEAAEAFANACRAWHAGIEVVAKEQRRGGKGTHSVEPPKIRTRPKRISSRLPVPTPSAEAVAAGHFGVEDGKPIRPSPDEVRAITEAHAQKLIDLYDELRSAPQVKTKLLREQIKAELAKYAEDFGEPAAKQLEAHAKRQNATDRSETLHR